MKVKRVTKVDGTPWGVRFDCPGCKSPHVLPVEGDQPNGARWQFNGDLDRPTLNPSILGRWYEMSAKGWADLDARNALPADQRPPLPENYRYDGHDVVCHSFVRDGFIQFLGDCTHALANQTVELPDIPVQGSA